MEPAEGRAPQSDGDGLSKPAGGAGRQIRRRNPERRAQPKGGNPRREGVRAELPRKTPRDLSQRPYRKPTQVGWYKDTKARERNLVKELGTIAP